ncbi:MAG TPA: hypothetical protein VFH75_07950 [Actinomycetota bacterium]|nr:hypothetical protein [Actinomycetota bacterium]
MIAFPLAATLVSALFGVHLLVRFGRRRGGNPAEGVWGVAMLMYAAASAALALGVLDEWSSAEFRTYWLFGAVLNVPYLAIGELYLLARNRWVGHALLVVALGLTAYATLEIRTATVSASHLAEEFPLGRDVFGDGSAPHRLAQYYSYPAYLFLLAGTVWSALRMRGQPDLISRFNGLLLLAVGATVVAVGSGVGAGLGNFAVFSIALAAGVVLMYWGFLTATRPRSARVGSGS